MSDFLIEPPAGPDYRDLQPLAGVAWPAEARPIASGARSGQIAMFPVDDAGELQQWERRGE